MLQSDDKSDSQQSKDKSNTNKDNSNNNGDVSRKLLFDDIDEDHFLVRKHLLRCSLRGRPWSGDSMYEGRTAGVGSSILLQSSHLSSVAKKPVLYPPSKSSPVVDTHASLDVDEADVEGISESFGKDQRSVTPLETSSSLSPERTNLGVDAISKLERAFSQLSLEASPKDNVADSRSRIEKEEEEEEDDDEESHVSTPDSLEEIDLKKLHGIKKNQSEDGGFKMETRNNCDPEVSKPASNTLSKIISYDEALNIPQTDDDKERMSSTRRKERPSNLIIHSPVRPKSARPNPSKKSSRGDNDIISSVLSLKSTSKTNLSQKLDVTPVLSPDLEKQEFLRRTQSFRVSRPNSRRVTMGPELVSQIQANARSISSKFEHLTPKDQKVLAVLLAKREQEREDEKVRGELKSLWDAEKAARERDSKLRQCIEPSSSSSSSFHQLRSANSKQNLRLDESFSNLVRTTSKSSLYPSTPCGHKHPEDCISEACPVFRSTATEEKKQNENRLKLQQAMERKRRVEQRIEEQKRKTEEHLREMKDRREAEQERAISLKKERDEMVKQKMSKQNESVRQKLEQMKEKKEMLEKETATIQNSIKATLTAAELKSKKLKEEEAAKIGKRLQSKIERAQQTQKSMEEELKVWRQQATSYRRQQDKHAEELQAARLAQRRDTLARSRTVKEQNQKQNLQKILEREKEWITAVEESIQDREDRRRSITLEKEAHLQKARAQVRLTRRLREELNLNQSLTDLDKLSKYVDLQRKIFS